MWVWAGPGGERVRVRVWVGGRGRGWVAGQHVVGATMTSPPQLGRAGR